MFGKGALIFVVGVGIVFGIIGIRLHLIDNRAIQNMVYYHDVTKSHNLASVGANAAMSKLYQDSTLRGVITTQAFGSGVFRGGTFSARVDSISAARLRMRSVSTYSSFSDTVEVYLDLQRFNSFSMFAWMTNIEGNINWITGDTVWGRVHSNDYLTVNGKPVFTEKVTTAKSFKPKPGTGTNNAIFKKGYETGVARIELPTDISELVNASTFGGRKYIGNIAVTLSPGTAANNDGKAYVRNSGGVLIDSVALSDPTFNGAILGTGRVSVQGTLDGRLSIGSLGDIYVTDNVLYEKSPLAGPSDDMLGLVADQNIVVADNAANNNNVEIDASIFARAGSFTAEHYSSRPVSGNLKVIGSIIQNTRGAVGTFSGPTLLSGFYKRYNYDPRLADPNVRPPFFPGFFRKTFAIADWWENVRIPQ